MINSNERTVRITGNKDVIQKDLKNIIQTLVVSTKLFTIRDIKKIIKYSCRKNKTTKIDKIIEKHYKKKRMKELDQLIIELKRKDKKNGI